MSLSVAEELELETLYEMDVAYHRQRKLWTYFEAIGPTRRELYAKHMEFFAAGADHTSRLFLKGNRAGGTDAGCCEVTYHLTGEYPPWWEGKRFDHPVEVWVAGVNGESTRNTLQEKFMGTVDIRNVSDLGTGFIPGAHLILASMRGRHGVSGGIEFVPVRHSSGGVSELGFKSFEQGHKSFQGTAKHVILLDELCPLDVLIECTIRIADTGRFPGGILLWTIAPEEGLTTAIQIFLPEGEMPQGEQTGSQHVTMASWDDVPHLTLETREAMEAAIPAYQLDARKLGRPMLGSGVVYPIARERYLCEPFKIPDHWRRGYGMDVGWNWTAVGWYAYDDETDTWYNYYVYKAGKAELSTHAHAIQSVGDWIPGVIDPAANGRSQDDGQQLLQQYRALGLHITPAKNAVESGIYEVFQRLSTSRLKIFNNLAPIEAERRTYARDKLGHIIKDNDHLMDQERYFFNSGIHAAKRKPVTRTTQAPRPRVAGGWGSV